MMGKRGKSIFWEAWWWQIVQCGQEVVRFLDILSHYSENVSQSKSGDDEKKSIYYYYFLFVFLPFFGSSFTCAIFYWNFSWLVCTFSFCHSSELFKPALFTTKPPWAMRGRCFQPSRSPLFMLHLQQSQKEIMSNLFTWISTKMPSISVLLREETFPTALIAQHKEFTAKKKGLSEGCFFTTEYSSSSEDRI